MIKRHILSELIRQLDNKYITVILGPRQVGKTTLARLLKQHLEAAGKESLFFNLDIEQDRRYFESQTVFLQKIQLEVGQGPVTVFIDEVQRKENVGLFLKGIYDQQLPIKFVVTGSGSLEIRSSVSESLAGRKRVFEISPITFLEFADHRTEYRYSQRWDTYFTVEQSATALLLQEYLSFGGYPDVVIADSLLDKQQTISELFNAYMDKDVVGLLQVSDPLSFSVLLRIMASRAGKMVNYTGLANEVNLSANTVQKYLRLAENTFIIKHITPYFNNIGKELTKSPQYYYADLGLRNYAAGQFALLPTGHSGGGFLFQNFIFQLLYQYCQRQGYILHYWRTTDKAEVDFVVNYIQGVLPVEVKYSSLKSPTLTSSFKSFLNKYSPPTAWVVNLDLDTHILHGTTRVRFIPWWKLLLGEEGVSYAVHSI